MIKRLNENKNKENVWAKEHYSTVYWRGHSPFGDSNFHHPKY